MIPSEDMLHLRWMALDNSLYGASRIGLAREAIGLALSQQELAGRLSANSTNLGGVLTTEQKLTARKPPSALQRPGRREAGPAQRRRHRRARAGPEVDAARHVGADAEVVAARNLQVQEIARLYRMPLHKLGIVDRGAGASIPSSTRTT
jgi:phage portal protein BeeE